MTGYSEVRSGRKHIGLALERNSKRPSRLVRRVAAEWIDTRALKLVTPPGFASQGVDSSAASVLLLNTKSRDGGFIAYIDECSGDSVLFYPGGKAKAAHLYDSLINIGLGVTRPRRWQSEALYVAAKNAVLKELTRALFRGPGNQGDRNDSSYPSRRGSGQIPTIAGRGMTHLPVLQALPQFELVAVSTILPGDRADRAAQTLRARSVGLRTPGAI